MPDIPTSDDERHAPAKMDVPLAGAATEVAADEGSAASTEASIRNAKQQIDLPYEAPTPKKLSYSTSGSAQEWTPPPGFRMGLPPIDSDLASSLGVKPDLGSSEGSDQSLPPPEDVDEPQWDNGGGPDGPFST